MIHNFDPYDALIELNERMNRMEHAHNALARAHQQSEQELNSALKSLKNLQQHHILLQTQLHTLVTNK